MTEKTEDLIAEAGGYIERYGVSTATLLIERLIDALEAATRERDAARAEIESRIEDRDYWHGVATRAKDQRDAALAAIERAKSEHKSTGYWIGSGPGEVHEREPDGKLCLTCSDDDTGERLDNWEFDTSLAGWQSWPCPTIQALDGAPEPEWGERTSYGVEMEGGQIVLDPWGRNYVPHQRTARFGPRLP